MPSHKNIVYPTIASFAASIGRALDRDFDFSIHRTKDLHASRPAAAGSCSLPVILTV
jgi:hypothetical protein